jgi:hypothetical protein
VPKVIGRDRYILTRDDLSVIFELRSLNYSYAYIAHKYSVDKDLIKHIINGGNLSGIVWNHRKKEQSNEDV